MTAATWAGGTHLDGLALGWPRRLAGVSMTLGEDGVAADTVGLVLDGDGLGEGEDGGLGADVAGGAAEGGEGGASGDADDGAAAGVDQVGQHGLGHQVGRAQVEGQLAFELLHRRLVDQAAGGVAADQVDQGPEGGGGLVGGGHRDHLGHVGGLNRSVATDSRRS